MRKHFILTALLILSSLCMFGHNDKMFDDDNIKFRKTEMHNEKVPGLPGHGEYGDQPAPIGSGTAMLIGFGAAYALSKKNKK